MITGVSRGLGQALSYEFSKLGHDVAGCASTQSAVLKLQAELGANHHFSTVNITRDEEVSVWVHTLANSWGVPDLVINNASIVNPPSPLWHVPVNQFEDIMSTNVTGVFLVIRHVLPLMIARGNGFIANISSGWGRSVAPNVASYCTSKWAIEGMTLALAEELPQGIATASVNPGSINTQMMRTVLNPDEIDAPLPDEWVKTAAPFFLALSDKNNGEQLDI